MEAVLAGSDEARTLAGNGVSYIAQTFCVRFGTAKAFMQHSPEVMTTFVHECRDLYKGAQDVDPNIRWASCSRQSGSVPSTRFQMARLMAQ